MLQITKLNQFYAQSHILHDIDMDVPEQACTCIVGRNGVGKTTLLKCIMGQLKAKAEAMSFAGQSLLSARADKRANLGIGYVPQGRQIFPLLTVEENLLTGLPVYRKRTGKRHAEIPDLVYEGGF